VLDALKMMLIGASLNEVLTSITRLIEAHSEGMLCSIFLLDEDGLHLRYGAAANLPQPYLAAIDGTCIGPNVGSCGAVGVLLDEFLQLLLAALAKRLERFLIESGRGCEVEGRMPPKLDDMLRH
jgi:hypothetical protein